MSAKTQLTAAAADNAAFTTSGALVDLVDKKVIIVLRDNRKLVGILRSYDQYANLVLQKAVERYYSGKYWAEAERDIYLVRGENVVMLGEVDLELEDVPLPGMERSTVEHVASLVKADEEARKQAKILKGKFLFQQAGFSEEHAEGDSYA